MSIRAIQKQLQDRGISISSYRIWKIIRKEELKTYKKILDEFEEVYAIDVVRVRDRYILILVDVKNECGVLLMVWIDTNRLDVVYNALCPYIIRLLKNSKTAPVFVMPRIKPLSLGPNGKNKLTNLIRRKGGRILFIKHTKRIRKFRKRVIAQLEKSTSMEERVKIIRDACKYVTTKLKEEIQ